MNYKLIGCVVMLLAILGFPASAATVSFLVVETGIERGIPATNFGTTWEDGLMTSFFDAGYIVTNNPILRVEERPERNLTGILRFEFYDALEGGADYFVMCFIDHELQGRRAVPVSVTVQKYRTSTQELIFEQNFPVGNAQAQSVILRNAQDAGRIIAAQINR